MQQKCLMHTSHFVLQNVKRYVLKWSRLNKVTFTTSSRIFFSETGFLFNCKFIVWRIQWLPVPLGTTIWGQQFYPPLLLHHQCFYNTGQKRQMKINFDQPDNQIPSGLFVSLGEPLYEANQFLFSVWRPEYLILH